MENLIIEKDKIYWEKSKKKLDSLILYKNEILKHDDHFSISKTMFVDGKYTRCELVHIPLELIDTIKDLKSVIDEKSINLCHRCEKKEKQGKSIYCIECLYERKMSGY